MASPAESQTGTEARSTTSAGASTPAIVLDARIARDCPRGAQPVSLGDGIGNLSVLILTLYGMVDAVIGTFTVPALKVLVRTLRRMGFSATVLTGRKSEIAASVREAATGHMVTLALNGSPPLPDEMVREYAHFGALGPRPGARAIITNDHGGRRLVFDDEMLIQDGVSPDASDRRQWVNTCYDAMLDPDHGSSHRVKRGVMQTADRFGCDLNRAFLDGDEKVPACTTPGGVPGFVAGQGLDAGAASAQIRGGICPVCNGPATVPAIRHGVSTLNGRFVHAVIVRPDGTVATGVRRYPRQESVDGLRHPVRAKDCQTRHGTLWTRCLAEEGEPGVDGFGYVEVEVEQWIGPVLAPVHTQKGGGRYAMKVNGRTVWVSGSFVRIVLQSRSFGELLVWAFFCNHDAGDRRRYPDYDPASLNRAASAVVNAAARAGISTAAEVKVLYDAEAKRVGGVV